MTLGFPYILVQGCYYRVKLCTHDHAFTILHAVALLFYRKDKLVILKVEMVNLCC